jgi:hypothetical protein
MKTKIYYSVANGGDGSAYPRFFYDEKCAQIHQDLMEEGWGESCIGSLTITHSGTKIELDNCVTKSKYIEKLKEELSEDWRSEDRKEILAEAIEKLSK